MWNSRIIRFLGKSAPALVGVLLVYSGLYKAVYPGEATLALMALGASKGVATSTISGIACMEIYLGVILATGVSRKNALLAVTTLMLLFTFFLFYLTTMANPPSCGCLGLTGAFSSNRQSAVFGLARNCLVLWLLRGAYEYYYPARP